MAIVLAMVLGAGVAAAAQQAGDAWLLLTSGERVDGVITTSSQNRGGFGQVFGQDRAGFVVNEGAGRLTRIPMSQVALIDFTRTRPAAAELASLPETGQLLVLNSGATRPGRLLELSESTIRWQPVRGPAMNVSLREVRRVYLDLDRSYELAQETGTWGPGRGFAWGRGRGGVAGQPGGPGSKSGDDEVATGGKSGGNVGAGGGSKSGANVGGGGGSKSGVNATVSNLAVLADQPWTDTGLNVRAGEMIRFEADGRIIFSQGNQNITGPEGWPSEAGARFPVPQLGIGGLIGKIGPTGRPFAIGARSDAVRMPGSGRLMLGVNDDHYDDNSGAFRVSITR
jgi:hypothetical protein